MGTSIQFLSHASAVIRTEQKSLIIDPWLIGSCYWRSWWNYPPVEPNLIEGLRVDAIYITHVHWDHWHGPTLKKIFPKDTLIITHREPNDRSINDLRSIGFNNILLLNHGENYRLGDISLTPYQFGLFMNDSALVVETPEMKLLNANDCKIAGTSLRSIINRHKYFDFALRSHSSANDRICYSLTSGEYNADDKDHYSKAFALFMNAVKPKYAIPFASNHCHLHKDVYSMNDLVNDPLKLANYLRENDLLISNVQLKVMLSGDSWSSENGFEIDERKQDYFLNKNQHMIKYRDSVQEKLEKYYKLENSIRPNDKIIQMFEAQIRAIPKMLRNSFNEFKYKMILFNDEGEYHYLVSPKTAKVLKCNEQELCNAIVRVPIKVFLDSVVMNMFHHSSISKRNKYIFETKEQLGKYEKFQDLLEYVELGVFPLRFGYARKLIRVYCRRWREVIVYIRAYLLSRNGMPMYHVEEEILKNT